MSRIQVKRIVNSILQSCSYILTIEEKREAFLVDCGDTEPILSFLQQQGKYLEGVLLTHAHYDHIFGLNALLTRFPDMFVCASAGTFFGMHDPDLNMCYLYVDDDFVVDIPESQRIIAERLTPVRIFDQEVECIPTPGHDVDCVSYRVGDMIFTGDSYHPSMPVFTKWRNSDKVLAKQNEETIQRMIKDKGLHVYPGHSVEVI